MTDDDGLTALASLRAGWVEEETPHGGADDGTFLRSFILWARSERRVFFLARTDDGEAVGMGNLAIFHRMPKPGAPPSCWAYLANMYVLEPHRNAGVGAGLLSAAVEHARDLRAVRLVTSPSELSRTFYARHGFTGADGLAVLPLA